MSKKKHRLYNPSIPTASPSDNLAAEYKIIRWDLLRVLIVNIIFLAAVLTLYYTNQNSGYLESWFSNILHF